MTKRMVLTPGRIVMGLAILAAAMGSFAFVATRPEREVTTRSAEARDAYMEGMVALRKVYVDEARIAWLKAVEADSTCSMAWLRLARLAYENGNVRLAAEYHARAEADMQRLTGRERFFIQLLAVDMKGVEAERDSLISEMVSRYPEDIEILFMAGNRDFHRKKYQEALNSFEKLLQKSPETGEVYNMMGYALGELGRWDKAVEAFQKYTFLYPDQANPHDSLGELYLRTGRYDNALKEFEKALALKPDFGWGHFHSAMVYAETGRNREARESVRSAISVSPDSPIIRMWERQEISLELAAGNISRALELAEAQRDANPDEPVSYFMLGRIYSVQGQTDLVKRELANVIRTYEELSRLQPGRPASELRDNLMVHELTGDIAAAGGDYSAADTCLTRALAKSNSWFMTRRLEAKRIENLIRAGKSEAAVAACERVLVVNPNEPLFHVLAARALKAEGKESEAPAHYRAALEVLGKADTDHPLVREVAENLSL
jgi:tetratricopeptide (TPR) repeat protein